jgi:hypothetical protein
VLSDALAAWLPLSDLTLLDTTRPIGLALQLSPNSVDLLASLLLPSSDPESMVAANAANATAETPMFTQIIGSYVAISEHAFGPRANGRSRLLDGGPRGLLTARIDLVALIEKYRPVILMGVDQLQHMADSGALDDPSLPYSMEALIDPSLEFLDDLLDSADLLDITLERGSSDLALNFALINRAGSALSKYARAEKVDYRELAGHLAPEAMMQMLVSMDYAAMYESIWPMYDGMLEQMEDSGQTSAEYVAAFRSYMANAKTSLSTMGPVAAASIDMHADGMRMSALYGSSAPQDLLRVMRDLLEDPALKAMGWSGGAPQEFEFDSIKGLRFNAQFLAQSLMQTRPPASVDTPDPLQMLEHFMSTIGAAQEMQYSWLPMPKHLALAAGGDDAWHEGMLRRLLSGGKAPTTLAAQLSTIEGRNPAMLVQVDIGRLMRLSAELDAARNPEAAERAQRLQAMQELGNAAVPATLHWGLRDVTWSAGLCVDFEGLLNLIAAMGD